MALYLSAKNLSYIYEESVENVLDSIALHIDSDSKIGLIGNNGSGKTTLLNILRGSLRSFSGQICGLEESSIGFLAQEIRMDEQLTLENYMRTRKMLVACIFFACCGHILPRSDLLLVVNHANILIW